MELTIVSTGNRPDRDIGVQQLSSHGFRRRDVAPSALDGTERLVDLDGFFTRIGFAACSQECGEEKD